MFRRTFARVLVSILAVASSGAASAADLDHVLIRSTGPRAQVRKAVEALGGTVTHEFQNVNAVAAAVPSGTMAALAAFPEFKVAKDADVALPVPRHGLERLHLADRGVAFPKAGAGAVSPDDYVFNNALIRADVVQASGNVGDGVVVAVIDSGTANSEVVSSLYGRVIGGESLVPPARDPYSATSTSNGPHGTWVGSVIAGRTTPGFPDDSCVAQSVRRYAPASSWIDGARVGLAGYTFVPLRGVAQGAGGKGARLYAVKVFPFDANSSPDSRILAAMDRVITLKRNFLAGKPSVPVAGDGSEENPFVYDSLDVSVVNMSLGGGSIDPGVGIEDQLVRQFLEVGIVPAISAGNAGPAGMSTGTPGNGPGAIVAAAAATPAHTRIVIPMFFEGCPLDLGAAFWPSDHLQTSVFSSRGPTPDGRTGVSVITAGDFNFVQDPTGYFAFVSGTSFAAPTVAGAAAVLRGAHPRATAVQVRNAVEAGANPRMLGDRSTRFDQGAGFLDVARSMEILRAHAAGSQIVPARGDDRVAANLEEAGLHVDHLAPGRSISGRTGPLVPGQRREWLVEVGSEVAAIRVDVRAVSLASPERQNQLFGDDVVLAIHSAKTTSFADYRLYQLVQSPGSWTVDRPDEGVVRITFLGDGTNASPAGADFRVTAVPKAREASAKKGRVAQGEWLAIPVEVPAGATRATFELGWKRDWAMTPTNDLDLYVIDPDGNQVLAYDPAYGGWYAAGATFASPEAVVADAPKPGTYTVFVNGYTVFGDEDAEPGVEPTDGYSFKLYLE